MNAAAKRGAYRSSAEELTPIRHDPRTIIPTALMSTAMLAIPGRAQNLTNGAVANYAISDNGWRRVINEHSELQRQEQRMEQFPSPYYLPMRKS